MKRFTVLTLAALPVDTWAAVGDEPVNTVWLVVAAALVFFMQTGFALLESGMSRSKNAVNVVMKNYMDVCLGSMVFWAFGFGIMFGLNQTGFFGASHWLPQFNDEWSYTFLLFQIMFAATATTIASGAMAERTRYSGYLVGAIIITGFIYPVFGSWGLGWFLRRQGLAVGAGLCGFCRFHRRALGGGLVCPGRHHGGGPPPGPL
ncbi:ammonium transporter [Ketobacter sp.]|uniref:ammonium transporter n=1 Tax=Ketobacter sp. TaxID=2083498 RepID=UPI0025BA4E02|nr:hypothetical protein [Ketobacter sp.]